MHGGPFQKGHGRRPFRTASSASAPQPTSLYATANENEVMGMLAVIVADVRGYKLEP